jgi:hypothetical protein
MREKAAEQVGVVRNVRRAEAVVLSAVQLQMNGRCTGRCCCDELRLGTTARPLQSPWWAMTKPAADGENTLRLQQHSTPQRRHCW